MPKQHCSSLSWSTPIIKIAGLQKPCTGARTVDFKLPLALKSCQSTSTCFYRLVPAQTTQNTDFLYVSSTLLRCMVTKHPTPCSRSAYIKWIGPFSSIYHGRISRALNVRRALRTVNTLTGSDRGPEADRLLCSAWVGQTLSHQPRQLHEVKCEGTFLPDKDVAV